MSENKSSWPLWEVFVQKKNGMPHEHVGSVHAPDAELAIQNARDVYTRRNEGRSIWVVPSAELHATKTEDNEMMFDPANDKIYRHPQFYKMPKGVNLDVG